MVKRETDQIIFICDECGAEEETDQTNFGAAWMYAKNEGWMASMHQATTKWRHVCPECQA